MVWQRALLCGAVALAAAIPVRAQDEPKKAEPIPAPAAAAPAPCTRKITVYEWVPEKYTTTRTVYKKECREETYTAYKCETVPVQKTREVVCYRKVPCVEKKIVECCVCVPVCEERTVMQKRTVCKPVCKTVRKCVDQGHWECKEVPCGPTLHDRLKKCFAKKNDCCDPCANNCCEPEPCPRTKTVKVWCAKPTWVETQVTCMEKVTECVPVTCKVTVYKKVMQKKEVNVCTYKCIAEKKTECYTCYEQRKVATQCKRMVQVCVPCQEQVTCCRMVCKAVEKEVAIANECGNDCCDTGCKRRGLFHRCKTSSCDSGCGSGCCN
jgi:hypothetical protein